jgi:hypothetical protein
VLGAVVRDDGDGVCAAARFRGRRRAFHGAVRALHNGHARSEGVAAVALLSVLDAGHASGRKEPSVCAERRARLERERALSGVGGELGAVREDSLALPCCIILWWGA